MNRFSFRQLCLAGFAICAGAMAFALYLQYALRLEPCPLCIFQRVAMISTALVFLVGAVHGPRRAGRHVYAILAMLTALAGAGVASRHVWLQSLPPDQVPACGPTLAYLLQLMPLQQVVATVLKGDGNCAVINASWLGVTLPQWTLLSFALLALYALLMPRLARRNSIFA